MLKAVRLHRPGDLRVEEIPCPDPLPGEVLIQVQAAGICGSDIPRAMEIGAQKMPIVIGHEFSGEVLAVGRDVQDWREGDRVVVAPLIPCFSCRWCREGDYSLCDNYDYVGSRRDGALAQYVTVPSKNLLRLPENVSYEDGALLDPAANALHAIAKTGINSGEIGVVFGAGPIGLFVIQFLLLKGAKKVIAVDIADDKLLVARDVGASLAINSLKEDVLSAVEVATDGEFPHVVIETAGAPVAQQMAIKASTKHGRIAFVGISHRDLFLQKETVDQILRKELTIIGSWNSYSSPFPGFEWRDAIVSFAAGEIKTKPIITHRFPLEEALRVFPMMKERSFPFSKVMFFPGMKSQALKCNT